MGRKKRFKNGHAVTFYLGNGDRRALEYWRHSRGHNSKSQALRELLRVVGEIEKEEVHANTHST